MKGKEYMKHLIIKKGLGYFLRDGQEIEISEITKEDIYSLIEKIITEPDFEMDTYDDSLLSNPAHKVIYKNLYSHFEDDVIKHRSDYLSMAQKTYKEAYQKYCTEQSEASEG